MICKIMMESDIENVIPLYINYYNKHESFNGKLGYKNVKNFVLKMKHI